jgi:hypothetical protein
MWQMPCHSTALFRMFGEDTVLKGHEDDGE